MTTIPNFNENPIVTIENLTGVKNCSNFNFLKTPYFKKYYRAVYNKMNDSNTTDYERVVTFFEFHNYATNIAKLCDIWSDIPNDHFQNYREFLESSSMMKSINTQTIAPWLQENLSYESFFNMIRSYLNKNRIQEFCIMFDDTMNQLVKLMSNKKSKEPVTRPNRWRLTEFHDHISYLYLKLNTKNTEHNNTLIPNPVDIDDWVVQQPKDTIQLKVWGQKVRNCVASYEDRILKNSLKIILLEHNSKPKFTVEIEPDTKRGVVIKQMVEQCNRQATASERTLAAKLIEKAIEHHHKNTLSKVKK